MPKSSKTLYREFSKKANEINTVRQSFEKANASKSISDIDIIQAYAGLYFDLFTEFERTIEALFLGLLNNDIKHNNTLVKRKLRISPKSEIENVLIGAKPQQYLDWIPYYRTTDRAAIYFLNKKPFDSLTPADIKNIDTYANIRHAIAHKSKKSLKAFNDIIKSLTLLTHEKTPAGYLRSIPNPAVGQTQFEIISAQLTLIIYTLCH